MVRRRENDFLFLFFLSVPFESDELSVGGKFQK